MDCLSVYYFAALLSALIICVNGSDQCFNFSQDILDGKFDSVTKGTCRMEDTSKYLVAKWNVFVQKQVNYLKMRHCMKRYGERQFVNETCMSELSDRFLVLFNNPQCCNVNARKNGRFSCYYNVFDPCTELNSRKERNSYFHQLCDRRSLCKDRNCNDLHVNGGYLHYFTAGCGSSIIDLPQYQGLRSYNTFTQSFMTKAFCNKAADEKNCCDKHLCNLPDKLDNSYYTKINTPKAKAIKAEYQPAVSVTLLIVIVAVLVILALATLIIGIAVSVSSNKICGWSNHYKQASSIGKSTTPSDGNSSDKLMSVSSPITGSSSQGDTQQSTYASYTHSDESSHTGSGAGTPILVPRTVAREIALGPAIGQGRFGQVLRATWRGDAVAVKIFSSRAESSWSTEGRIYELPGIRHDNILGFIAIDNMDAGWETQLWLITDYHAHGSLQNYLTYNTIDIMLFARMAAGIANGIAHLHTEIRGVKNKPAIAHRDIKSNNILVKADLTCCIADFGLAVDQKSESPPTWESRVGTKRYLSPECLDGSIAFGSFASLLQSDIYSLGLVLWELGMRCYQPMAGVEAACNYEQPYQSMVSANPSIEEMASVVCKPASLRPALPTNWLLCPVLGQLCRLLTECWYCQPSARLASWHVKGQAAVLLAKASDLVAMENSNGNIKANTTIESTSINNDNQCTVLA